MHRIKLSQVVDLTQAVVWSIIVFQKVTAYPSKVRTDVVELLTWNEFLLVVFELGDAHELRLS